MHSLNINGAQSLSIILQPGYAVLVTGSVSVYRTSAGNEPITLTIDNDQIGPFQTTTTLSITVRSGNATVSDPMLILPANEDDPVITVNGQSGDVVLSGQDLTVIADGDDLPTASGDIEATDDIATALAKLQARIVVLENPE